MLSLIYLSTVAILCTGMGFYLLIKRVSLFVSGHRAVGTFVRWEQRGLRRTYYHPVVRFLACDGQNYEFVGGPGSTSRNEKVHYAVVYPRDNPQAAMVYGLFSYWAAPITFFIFAGAMTLAAYEHSWKGPG